jgi:hypothetical protein
MASSTLTRWLLRAFADEWPGGLPGSNDSGGPLTLIDRDESRVLSVDTGTSPTTLTRDRHSQHFEHNTANSLGVAQTSREDTPAGLGGSEYRVEPVLSVRIQGADAREHGHIADGAEFKDLYETALDVVKGITNGTLQDAPVANFYVSEPGTQDPQLSDWKDFYTYQFEVRPRGYQS